MELLINALLKKGARRERMEAKVFGGARMVEGLSDIGERNSAFVKKFLENEGVRIVAKDLGGSRGRRIEFFPVSGRVRQMLLPVDSGMIKVSTPRFPDSGTLELF